MEPFFFPWGAIFEQGKRLPESGCFVDTGSGVCDGIRVFMGHFLALCACVFVSCHICLMSEAPDNETDAAPQTG